MLNRLLIRERVNLLVALPLVVMLFMTVPFVADRLQSSRDAHANAELAASVRRIGLLTEGLGRERAMSVAFVLTRNARSTSLVEQSESVGDEVYEIRRSSATPSMGLAKALSALSDLDRTRARVLAHRADVAETESAYDNAVDGLIASLNSAVPSYASRQVLALSALIQGNEQANRAANAAMAALLDPGQDSATRSRQFAAQTVAEQIGDEQLDQFRKKADTGQAALFKAIAGGAAAHRVTQLEAQAALPVTAPAGSAPRSQDRGRLASEIYAAVETEGILRGLAQEKIARDTAEQTNAAAEQAGTVGWVFVGVALFLFVATLLLSVMIGRSIAGPLHRLTLAAGRVADLAGAELDRVADEEGVHAAPPRLAAIALESDDEIGELAGAVNRVQAVAVLLLERQVASRANISSMFRSVGRRTQNLVSRQTAMIDVLEANERDSDVVEQLYRLDHLTARLRRHADSLLVLSGWNDPALVITPSPLTALIRSSFGGVEEFRRIDLDSPNDVQVSSAIAADLILLLAELLDNATRFSPPHTQVRVTVHLTDDGCQIAIEDQGVGMPPERMAQENQRIVTRERLDLLPTDVLGLFVVGRLCRRHGLNARLQPGPKGGVAVLVDIPHRWLAPAAPASAAPTPAPVAAAPVTAVPAPVKSAPGPRPSAPAATLRGGPRREGGPSGRAARPMGAPGLRAVPSVPTADPSPAPRTGASTDAPAGAGSGGGGDALAGAARAAFDAMPQVRRSLERLGEAERSRTGQPFGWFDDGGDGAADAPPAREPLGSRHVPESEPPGAQGGLIRRVPGTHLPGWDAQAPSAPAPQPVYDAEALRATLDDFEAAVGRGRAAAEQCREP